MTEGPIFHVEITAGSLADLKAFTDEVQPDDLGCRPVVRRRGAEFVVDAYLPEEQLERRTRVTRSQRCIARGR